MCFKKIWQTLFGKPDVPPTPIPDSTPDPSVRKRALLFGINDYGGANDLNGCLNDIDDVEKKLNIEFPGFLIQKFKDSEVTKQKFYTTIKDTLVNLVGGDILYIHYSGHGTTVPSATEANGRDEALYLYDGVFLDDRIQELQAFTPTGVKVIAKFDSCFSGDLLRDFVGNPHPVKNRFMPPPDMPPQVKAVKRFAKRGEMRWVVFSGSSESQTSADAYISGRYNGAFTYFDNKSYNATSKYIDEINKLHSFLPGGGYDQNPTIDGDVSLFDDIVFQ